MRKLALAVSVLGFASSAATAADMPLKTVVPPPPVLSWAGFYIGAHGGYGWKDDPFTAVTSGIPTVTLNGVKARGWLAGVQTGYNWQVGAMVGGLEADLSGANIKGTSSSTNTDVDAVTTTVALAQGDEVKVLGTIRGRLGWAPNSDWLLYATGGAAWEHLNQTQVTTVTQSAPGVTASQVQTTSSPFDFFGWVVGAGVEGRILGSNWIGRLEYLHYDFGRTRNTDFTVRQVNGVTSNVGTNVGNQTIDVVRVALSYKFGN